MQFFGNREPLYCVLCKKELKHKYKPGKDWGIEGFLCADCHIEKTKEFMLKEQEVQPELCALCRQEIEEGTGKKARWQWNLDAGAVVCDSCFDSKESEYEKAVNYCSVCNVKMGFVRYNPKPAWKLKGQLCRKCWDQRNSTK
ncbi:MAG: hypothetical protein ABI361_02655 [Nitrososphaera sp.]